MSKKQKDLINFADDMNEKTIREALLKGERVTLECKRAKIEVPKSVWMTYSAFANTIGGVILLGVNEDMQEKEIFPESKLAPSYKHRTNWITFYK